MSADRIHRRRLLLSVFLVLACVLLLKKALIPTHADHAQQARAALQRGDFDTACEQADQAVRQRPSDIDSIAVGAEAAEKAGQLALAIEFLKWLPTRFDNSVTQQLWLRKAGLQERLGRISNARCTLETVVQHVPDDAACRRRLARLLSGYGYRFEALRHAEILLRNRQALLTDLVLLGKNGRSLSGRDQLQRTHSLNPDDEMSTIGLLQLAVDHRDAADAEALLTQAEVQTSSPSPEMLRRTLLFEMAMSRSDALRGDIGGLLRQLHQQAAEHPDTWLVTAEWARQHDRPVLQRRCLIETLQRDCWNRRAIHALAAMMKPTDPKTTEKLINLERTLSDIALLARRISVNPHNDSAITAIAAKLNSIGRHQEAQTWAGIQLRLREGSRSGKETISTQVPETPWRHPVEDLTDELRTPLAATDFHSDVELPLPAPLDELLLEDSAAAVGIRFRYDNGAAMDQEGLRMHQWTGGGVAAVDIDHDAWPDLYFTQGGDLLSPTHSQSLSDELFRNRRGAIFDPIARVAGIRETSFGQGVAAGDVNHDGFEDLYVANVGMNRLLINQGDGTFQAFDVSVGGSVWTTSVAIADLNGNGTQDLYDVNYLCGPDVFTATCDHDGYQRVCGPTDFSAEPDQRLLSDGTGVYIAADNLIDPAADDGRGMGLVISDLNGSGRNQVYVANDESANHLYAANSHGREFAETAMASGLAFDHYGQAQGSMGIALGDVDHNGLPDLFVTNYYAEPNTLYSQVQPSVFVDAAASARLASPGYGMLGFGCQLPDVDGDGDLDLVVINGHVDDFSHKRHPWRMRPQLFRNDGFGRYTETNPQSSFFQTPTLGRSVALIDWNRDGRCDFAVSQLDGPSALVTNETPTMAAPVQVSLVGVSAARMPIGGSIVVETSGTRQTGWVTAGDGYQCSNERLIRLFCDGPGIPQAEVRWPGNIRQNVVLLQPGLNTIIEGRPAAYSVPK